MKVKDIASQHGFDHVQFENWLQTSRFPYKLSFLGVASIEDEGQIVQATQQFQAYLDKIIEKRREEQVEANEKARREEIKQQALAGMLITSGFSFDGFKITKYSGYISGDDVVQIDRGREGIFSSTTDVGSALMASLTVIRRNALNELKEAAYELGCNAVIGVDFDYLTLDPETVNAGGGTLYLPYVFGITANGNAVIIEKNS